MDYEKYLEQYNKIGYGKHGITLIPNFIDDLKLSKIVKFLDSIPTDGLVARDSIEDEEMLQILKDSDLKFYDLLKEHYGDKYGVKILRNPRVLSHFLKWNLGYESVMPVHSDCETKDGKPVFTNGYYKYNLTIICYLNDDYVGGEITFPQFDLTIKPKAGDLIMFPSRYRHGVLQMHSGNRYSLPSWFSFDVDDPEDYMFSTGNAEELF